jgi:hypothetical protein
MAGFIFIMLRFLYWHSYVKVILSSNNLIMLLLNLIRFLAISYSYSLAIYLALYSLPCLMVTNSLSARNKVLLVYRPTILNSLLLYKRQGL